MSKKVRVIEFQYGKHRQCGGEIIAAQFAICKRIPMHITEKEADDIQRLAYVHGRMFSEENVNVVFFVIPDGLFLPVPISHYQP